MFMADKGDYTGLCVWVVDALSRRFTVRLMIDDGMS